MKLHYEVRGILVGPEPHIQSNPMYYAIHGPWLSYVFIIQLLNIFDVLTKLNANVNKIEPLGMDRISNWLDKDITDNRRAEICIQLDTGRPAWDQISDVFLFKLKQWKPTLDRDLKHLYGDCTHGRQWKLPYWPDFCTKSSIGAGLKRSVGGPSLLV